MKNPHEQFAGRRALITGGSRRIGRAIALELAAAGCNVLIHCYHSEDEAGQTAQNARDLGVDALVLRANLNNRQESEGLILRAVKETGPIDFLINNASIFPHNTIDSFTFENLIENIQVNAYAPLQLMRAFFNQQQQGGAIVNLLDTRILSYDREHIDYHLSKRMLHTLTKIAAVEFAPGVRVNAVAPGLILPPAGEDMSWLEKLRHTNPLQSYGSVEDISDATLFLLGSEFITGHVLYVDGGKHLQRNFYG